MELARSLGNVSQAAAQLGIPDVTIHSWRKQLNALHDQPALTSLTAEQEEIKKLRKEKAE